MLFDDYQESIDVYENVQGVGFVDPVWTYITTIQGRFEPVQGNEALINGQTFGDVSEILMADIEYRTYIKPGIGLIGDTGIQRRVAGEPEDWKWDLIAPHFAVRCQREQWVIE